ncbi:hypothetical protein DPX39_050031100 [Trypanosoma brucei equiperdum]|uniref:Uncharacterized protein n=1 Tax=Trypanosoma brucei equiperdum TaxID=630700 RepID=A0A3L6L7D4_9TRYP|nr:hypothetical protein DPX39_050031100 [Trypanosoma brucei equiperdum]
MVNNEGYSHRDVMTARLLVETVDSSNHMEEYSVQFIFFRDTTVEDVLQDVEEKLNAVGLRLSVPPSQCGLTFKCNDIEVAKGSVGGAAYNRACKGDEKGVTMLRGTDRIFGSPAVEHFYCNRKRLGCERVAQFMVVQRRCATLPTGTTASHSQERKEFTQQPPTCDFGGSGGFSRYLLPRQPLVDLSSRVGTGRCVGATVTDDHNAGTSTGYGNLDTLSKVRRMVEEERQLVFCFGQDRRSVNLQMKPVRHWSSLLKEPPSRCVLTKAVEDEKAAYERLTKLIRDLTISEAAKKAAERDMLEKESKQLREKISRAKGYIERRKVMKEEVERLRKVLETRKEEEERHLQSKVEKNEREIRPQQGMNTKQCSPPVASPASTNVVIPQSVSLTEKQTLLQVVTPASDCVMRGLNADPTAFSLSTTPTCFFLSCQSAPDCISNRGSRGHAISPSISVGEYKITTPADITPS